MSRRHLDRRRNYWETDRARDARLESQTPVCPNESNTEFTSRRLTLFLVACVRCQPNTTSQWDKYPTFHCLLKSALPFAHLGARGILATLDSQVLTPAPCMGKATSPDAMSTSSGAAASSPKTDSFLNMLCTPWNRTSRKVHLHSIFSAFGISCFDRIVC